MNMKNVFMKRMRIKNLLKGIFNSALQKNIDSSTSTSETSENVFLFVCIFLFVSFGVCIYHYVFTYSISLMQ